MPSSPPGSSSTTSRNGGSGWKLSCISMSAKNSINPPPRKLVKLARQLLCTSRIKFPYKWSQIIDFGCTLSTPFFLLSSPGHGTRTNTERCVCEFVFFFAPISDAHVLQTSILPGGNRRHRQAPAPFRGMIFYWFAAVVRQTTTSTGHV